MDINLIGPINQLGYGIVTLNIVKHLAEENRVSLWIIGRGEAHPDNHMVLRLTTENALFFNNTCPCLRIWHQFDMAMMVVGKGKHIGLPIFELNNFNKLERHHLNSLDTVFVSSQWARNVLVEQDIKTPVYVTPFGVDTNIFKPISEGKLPNPATTFLNVGKWEVRKGHDILVEAFNKAFEPNDNVMLIMNCYNPFLVSANQKGEVEDGNQTWINMYKNSKLGDKIKIFTDRLETQYDVAGLMNAVDAGVFPARAEGWNLEALEMLACGKPIIVTDYSGHTEFCNEKNSYLIKISNLETAFDGKWFKGQGEWAELAEEQLDSLVEHMRTIHKRKQSGDPLYNEKGIETAKQFSWYITANKICEFAK